VYPDDRTDVNMSHDIKNHISWGNKKLPKSVRRHSLLSVIKFFVIGRTSPGMVRWWTFSECLTCFISPCVADWEPCCCVVVLYFSGGFENCICIHGRTCKEKRVRNEKLE